MRKMEITETLAKGVTHDFRDILFSTIRNTEMIMAELYEREEAT
jgi:hypothetical protein